MRSVSQRVYYCVSDTALSALIRAARTHGLARAVFRVVCTVTGRGREHPLFFKCHTNVLHFHNLVP